MTTVAACEDLMNRRAGLIHQAGKIVDRAKAAGRDMTGDEAHTFDRLHDDAADLQAQINGMSRSRQVGPGRAASGSPNGAELASVRSAAEDRMAGLRATAEYRAAFAGYLETGRVSADLQADQAEKGGYMVPTEFAAEIAKSLDNTFWFRRLANVLPQTTAESVQIPRQNSRMGGMQWGAELTTPAKDTQLTFGQVTLAPGWMCGEIDVSNSLLASGVVDVESFVMDEINYAAAELEELAFMTGDGVRKPLGVFVPHADGIPASRDTVGSISTDALYDAKFSIRDVYLRSGGLSWVGSRPFVKDCAKLKDSLGNPLWVVSVRDGEPDWLIGVPLTLSEYALTGSGTGGAWAGGDYAAVLGDFQQYDVLDGLDMSIQRLNELEARRNLVAFIIRRKVAGCARHGEAFARLKLA